MNSVELGWVFEDTNNNASDGLYVVDKTDKALYFNDPFSHNISDVAYVNLKPIPVNSTNGFEISSGTLRTWHSSNDSQILRQRMTFVVASGATVTLKVGYQVY